MTTADDIIAALDLAPHPEGGWFREVFRDPGEGGSRGAATHIYYLLRQGERSAWHRIDALEVWHVYAGALALFIAEDGQAVRTLRLGANAAGGQVPSAVVPVWAWQAAEPVTDWVLCGCTVAPAFRFAGFEMAPPDWTPPGQG